MRKKAQQMTTMLLMGLREERRVWTTSLRPGALLITLRGLRARIRRSTLRTLKKLSCLPPNVVMKLSMREMMTRDPSSLFQLSEK